MRFLTLKKCIKIEHSTFSLYLSHNETTQLATQALVSFAIKKGRKGGEIHIKVKLALRGGGSLMGLLCLEKEVWRQGFSLTTPRPLKARLA